MMIGTEEKVQTVKVFKQGFPSEFDLKKRRAENKKRMNGFVTQILVMAIRARFSAEAAGETTIAKELKGIEKAARTIRIAATAKRKVFYAPTPR